MPRANGRLRCNGSPLARGDDFDCRCFDFGPVGSRANACRCRSAHRNILDPDRFEALLGDAKRHGSSFSIASQARSEPLARTSSSSRVRMSLSTAFRTASPVTFVGRSTPRSLRREAVDRMTSWVSVRLAIGFLHCVRAASYAATTAAPPRPCSRRGKIPRARRARKPSHYRSVPVRMPVLSWIMLLLSLGVLEHGMIDASRTPDRAPDYESGGQEFESLRSRQ